MRSGIVIKNPSLGLTSLWEKPQKFAGQLSQTDKTPRRRLLICTDLTFSPTTKASAFALLPLGKALCYVANGNIPQKNLTNLQTFSKYLHNI